MKVNNSIYSLLLIISFQYYVSAAKYSKYSKYYDRALEKELIDILKRYQSRNQINSDETTDRLKNDEVKVDPNDHIHVKLWNKLNDDDIQKMPHIDDYSNEDTAMHWLQWHSSIALRYTQISAFLEWNYNTDINKETVEAQTAQNLLVLPFERLYIPIAKKFNKYMKHSTNEDLKRIFDRLARGTISHNDNDVKETSELESQMVNIYSTTEVCEPHDNKKCYLLSPYLEPLMGTEKNYDRLLWAWKGWYDGCGDKIRPLYLSFVDLLNKDARENGYKDLSEIWIGEYEMGKPKKFESILDQILEDIMPLYKELHGFVRGRLCEIYPSRFNCSGPIPAHILGNMWAQNWQNRLDDVIPYPAVPLLNMTQILYEKKYTVNQMYSTAENFFTSIDLYSMTPKFWASSMFTKPKDRDVVCHAAAFDMLYHDDYRVKICTQINDDYFYTVHHEMGHIEYYMAYSKQPFLYRNGANSGFHEAIGDTIGMYAISPPHLLKFGFVDQETITKHYEINFLMRLALQKIAFLPFAYVMDKYRFDLFRGQINRQKDLNGKWWELRNKYGGIMPPVPRHDPENFDPGAKFHVPSNVPYTRYFIAHILQFQFYRALCRLQGQTEQLHMCDIYGNKEVGEKFKKMLELGSSKSWPEILESLTGENKLESRAILDFFEPLYKWLKKENAARGYPVGWIE